MQCSKNIQHKTPEIFSQFLESNFNNELSNIFKDFRLQDVDANQYDSFQSLLVDLITKNDSVKLGVIGKLLSFESCIVAPSIKSLINAKFLQEKNVIVILTLLVNQLSSFFDKPTTSSIEELACMIYDDYSHLSIEDLIKFIYLSKRKHFVSEYQHISSRGINADFLLDWLKKYDLLREETKKESLINFRKQGKNIPSSLSEYDKKKIGEIGKIRVEKRKQQLKIERLQNTKRKNNILNEPRQELLEFIANEELWFTTNHCLLSHQQRMKLAQFKVEELIFNWGKGYDEHFKSIPSEKKNESGILEFTTDNFIKRVDENGVEYLERVPSLTAVQYINNQINIYLKRAKRKLQKNTPYLLFKEGLEKFTTINSIQNGNELMQLLNPDYMASTQCEPSRIIPKLAKQLSKQLHASYSSYKKEKLAENQLPMKKDDYLRKRAQLWVVKNCFRKLHKTSR